MTQRRRHGVLLVVVVCLLGSLIQSHEAYAERKKVSGTAKGGAIAQSGIQITVGDASYGVGNLQNRLWVYSSTDPEWNNAKGYSVIYVDEMTKSSQGFTVVTHPGGDQTFQEFEGTWEGGAMAGYTDQIQGRFLGGTGKFKGITGRWTTQGKGIATDITREWEAEYEIKQ